MEQVVVSIDHERLRGECVVGQVLFGTPARQRQLAFGLEDPSLEIEFTPQLDNAGGDQVGVQLPIAWMVTPGQLAGSVSAGPLPGKILPEAEL